MWDKEKNSVGRRPINANLRLSFNPGFFISLYKSLVEIVFSILFRASNNHILDKNNNTEFSIKAFISNYEVNKLKVCLFLLIC